MMTRPAAPLVGRILKVRKLTGQGTSRLREVIRMLRHKVGGTDSPATNKVRQLR